jgi:hypothetical protein
MIYLVWEVIDLQFRGELLNEDIAYVYCNGFDQ